MIKPKFILLLRASDKSQRVELIKDDAHLARELCKTWKQCRTATVYTIAEGGIEKLRATKTKGLWESVAV